MGVRARIVWVQDMGDGKDVGAQGDHLRLMGLDTEDGKGERAILAEESNYLKPLLTPGGDRIVFSNRKRAKSYVVNWDGSGLREVADGLAADVWKDPKDGGVWVYLQEKDDKNSPIRRARLDKPAESQPVWNKTAVDAFAAGNFQLSADGKKAGGLFPWSESGVADLPNGPLTRLGGGCWTSLAPDNSYRFWVFNGSHRDVTMFDHAGGEGRKVVVNDAPGIDGVEVYHPRWSNDPRYMAMTGPYKLSGIDWGGPGVEIYLGRFDPGFTRIERWVRVTHNDRADFFPDVWVAPAGAPAPKARAALKAAPASVVAKARASKTGIPGRIVVRAKLLKISPTPPPASIAPYRRCLAVYEYAVHKGTPGASPLPKKILVAHWVIKDGKALPLRREVGKTYSLTLEDFSAHPELDKERQVQEGVDFDLDLFYDVKS